MKLIIVAVVFLFIGVLFGSVVMAVLAAGKTMEEDKLKMWEEYEEQKNKK